MTKFALPRGNKYRRRVGRLGAIDSKHDGSVIDLSVAQSCYNFECSSGALRHGYGIDYSDFVHMAAARYWIYNYYNTETGAYDQQRVYQTRTGMLCFWSDEVNRAVYISGASYPKLDAVNYKLNSKYVMLLSGKGKHLYTWDGASLVEHVKSPLVSSMALHNERLFVTSQDEKYRVYFSKNLDPTNWDISADGGGFIELLDERGYCNKAVSFKSYLYVFREHGITRISAYGDQKKFSVFNLFVSAGRIIPSSIATCGNVIMFLASDGIYAFDGAICRKVLSDISGAIVPDDNCSCSYHDGKYFLACRMDFGGGQVGCESKEYETNALLVYDLSSGEYSVSRGMDIRFLNSCSFKGNDYLMACEKRGGGVISKCGGAFGIPLPKHWQSPPYDFSTPDKLKRLRSIVIQTTAPVSVTVDCDGVKSTYETDGGSIKLFVSCYRASISLDTSAQDCTVAPFTVIYSSF